MKWEQQGRCVTLWLPKRIDSVTAPQMEADVNEILRTCAPERVEMDAQAMEFISSAGMRVILRVRKACASVRIFNVNTAVYEIFSQTGFTEFMIIETCRKHISLEGCELIGEGRNGKVYRLNDEQVVKVFKNPDALEDIRRERELARIAFVADINTAIPFEVVTVGGGCYGAVFELLHAQSVTSLIRKNPDKIDEYINLLVDLLKNIHRHTSESEAVPSARQSLLDKIPYLIPYMDEKYYNKLSAVIRGIPETDYLIHNDFQTSNVLVSGGESFLLDMDTLSKGVPLMEFASIYAALQGYGESRQLLSALPEAELDYLWKRLVQLYWQVEDISPIEDRCKLIAMPRVWRHTLQREPDNRKLIDFSKTTLLSLLDKYDTDCLKGWVSCHLV